MFKGVERVNYFCNTVTVMARDRVDEKMRERQAIFEVNIKRYGLFSASVMQGSNDYADLLQSMGLRMIQWTAGFSALITSGRNPLLK
jgi:hypothetical protein